MSERCTTLMWDNKPCVMPAGHDGPHSAHVLRAFGTTVDEVLEAVAEVLTEQQGTCSEQLKQALREHLEEVSRE